MFNELEYKYQPIVDLHNLVIIRQEALLRGPDDGDVEGLINEMEENGSIVELDLHTLTSAVSLLNACQGMSVPIAVNLSAQSLDSTVFQHEILSHLADSNISGLLSIEITETSPIRNPYTACSFIRRLKQNGHSVGIDDYGDGFATLEQAESMRVNYLKLSSKLTTRVLSCERAQEAVREAIRVSNMLGIPIVAEHVDNAAQLAWLRDAGVAHGQGWLFAKAGDLITHPDDFTSDLRNRLGNIL